MIYLLLAYEFFKTGLFSFGGGYATIPFLYNISQIYGWYTIDELTKMFAVASITPGPVGINTATYAGFKTAGILGALFATVSEIIPSLICVIIVCKLLKKFSDNFYVKAIIKTLKPISCGLLIFVAIGLIKPSVTDIKAMILLTVLLIMSYKSKLDPIFYFGFSALAGLVIACLKSFII